MQYKCIKKIISFILILAMMFAILPQIGFIVSAADDLYDYYGDAEDQDYYQENDSADQPSYYENSEDFEYYYQGNESFPSAASGINYSNANIIITGSNNGSINLTKETITLPYNYIIKAYSVDGGEKWKAVKDDPGSQVKFKASFSKLLSKDLKLSLSNKDIDKNTKQPESNATIIAFPIIKKRQSPPKVEVNYAIGADKTGKTAGDWLLTNKDATSTNYGKAVKDGIEIAETKDNKGKEPNASGYGRFAQGENNGISVKNFDVYSKKVIKTIYFVRTAPTNVGGEYIAASKPLKITVSGENKPVKYKADYKKEMIKLKVGDIIFAGPANVLSQNNKNAVSTMVPTALNKAEDNILQIANTAATGISLSDYLTENAETILIWTSATAKKAATAKQIYMLAPRGVMDFGKVIKGSNKGTLSLDAKYEVLNNGKWSNNLSAITQPTSLSIRIKPGNVKANGVKDEGYITGTQSQGTITLYIGKDGILYGVILKDQDNIACNLFANKSDILVGTADNKVRFLVESNIQADEFTLYANDVEVGKLYDDGNYSLHGDDIKGDGIYSGIFTNNYTEDKEVIFAAKSLGDSVVTNEVKIEIITPLTDDELTNIDTVDTAIDEILNDFDYQSATLEVRKEKVYDVLTSLVDQGLIIEESIYYDEETYTFSYEYKDGILGGVIIKDFGEDYDGIVEEREAAAQQQINEMFSVPEMASGDIISDNIGTAIILNAFENTPFRRNYYPTVKTDWDSKGLITTINTNVTVSAIKNLKGYDVIWFAGHGAAEYTYKTGALWWAESTTGTIWLLNEKYTKTTDKAYSADLKKHRVIHINANLGKSYAMFPSLISDSYGATDFNNSFIIFNSCEIMGKNDNISESMANAFLNCSAKSFIGYHNSVDSDYSREFMKIYGDNLIDGHTAQESFNNAVTQRGANDGGAPAAYPLLRGDPNATLVNTELKNGSFELSSAVNSPIYWKSFADVRVIEKLGELTPRDGKKMAMLSTGIGSAPAAAISSYPGATQGSIMQQTVKLSNVVNTLTFDYNMFSEEPPEFVGTIFNDTFVAQILDKNGNELKQIAFESVNTSTWLHVSGFYLTIGKSSGRVPWQTGWKTAVVDLTPYRGQTITLRFLVFDRGDGIYDSGVLLDKAAIK